MSFAAKVALKLMDITVTDLAGSAEEQLEKARKFNAKNGFVKPSDHKAEYRVEKIQGVNDLLIVRSKKRPDNTNSAVLFIFGGGGMMNEWKMHLPTVRSMVNRTGAEVFMPMYPLLTDAPVSAAVETAYETYKRVLKDYSPDKITLMGDSSGGACCLALLTMINRSEDGLKQPKLAILHSPSGVPHNEEAWSRMREQSKKDVPGILARVECFPEICSHGEEIPDYTLYPATGDFRNAPETYIYYSADETLASLGQDLEEAYKRCGAKIHIHYEPGMMHCYSAFPLFKESKLACNEWMKLIEEI